MNNQSYRGYGFSRSVRDVVSRSPREQYELAVSNFVPQNPGRKGWHVTPARRQYNTKRTEQLRSTLGRETMKQVSEALDSKLAVGMKEIEDALNQIEANKTLVAVTTLVTTRTMGFCAAQIYFQASAQRNPVFCNIYSFYRVNLAMFEAGLYHIRSSQEAPTQLMDEVEVVPVRPDFFLVTQTVNAYPDQVGRVIKTTGVRSGRIAPIIGFKSESQVTAQSYENGDGTNSAADVATAPSDTGKGGPKTNAGQNNSQTTCRNESHPSKNKSHARQEDRSQYEE
jgi:hypothetical protein